MNSFTLEDIYRIAVKKDRFELTSEWKELLAHSFRFLEQFSSDKIIYGINTGFGPMAQFRIEPGDLNQLQYNLIRSHSSGTGEVLSEKYVRAVVMARIVNFLQGNSGISPEVVEKLTEFLNAGVTPEIFVHGGVGASGDLVQLAHLGLNLIGEGYVYVEKTRIPTAKALLDKGIQAHKIRLRDGLGLMNGTSCMTGIGALNILYSETLLGWSIASSAMVNELVEAYDDSFSTGLNSVKKHAGQQKIAAEMRSFLSGSQLIRKREELFADDKEQSKSEFTKKIQEYYSIRCVPQILGPVNDTIAFAREIVENELNSTNDNPVVREDEDNVLHGGNFHGDYVSLEMDKLKLVVTRVAMLAERQLNFLMNARINGIFPPFLNAGKLGFNFGIQGIQFTAVSTTAENQTLSNPMYVHSIPNNNDNQDIVSMGTNSAYICKRVVDNAFQVMAIHMMAICQAYDLLGEDRRGKMSEKSKAIYHAIRSFSDMITEDKPQFETIASITEYLKTNKPQL